MLILQFVDLLTKLTNANDVSRNSIGRASAIANDYARRTSCTRCELHFHLNNSVNESLQFVHSAWCPAKRAKHSEAGNNLFRTCVKHVPRRLHETFSLGEFRYCTSLFFLSHFNVLSKLIEIIFITSYAIMSYLICAYDSSKFAVTATAVLPIFIWTFC